MEPKIPSMEICKKEKKKISFDRTINCSLCKGRECTVFQLYSPLTAFRVTEYFGLVLIVPFVNIGNRDRSTTGLSLQHRQKVKENLETSEAFTF